LSAADFIYDGVKLSEFKNGAFLVANFTTGNTPTEGQRNINQTPLFMGKEQPFLYQNYTSTLTFTISIIKNPCYDSLGVISIQDMEDLKRWLCRPAPHAFKLTENEYKNIFWEGSFNITEELRGSTRIGATLTFVSTRPFALQEDTIFSNTVEAGETITITDTSVELGYIYPNMTVKCLEAGDLIITSDFEDRQTVIKNCKQDEIITFSKYLQIESSDTEHALYDDFNYKFPRICNNINTNVNNITFSLACEYSIIYNPIRKVIPV